MPFHAIQPTFAGGEFAPSLHSRVDLQKYGSGLKKARNMIIHPHGGASNRPGLRYVSTVKYPTRKTRVVSFEFSVTQAYAIEFGHLYCRFHLDGGTMTSDGTPGGAPYEVTTPYKEEDLAKLKFTQSADVLYIVHPDHAPRMLVRYADSPPDWRLENFAFENGPFMVSNIEKTKTVTASGITGSITLSASADVFGPEHVGALFRLRQDVEGHAVNTSFTGTGVGASIRCGGTWRIITHGSWGGKIQIEKSADNGATWAMLRQFTSKWGPQSNGADGGDYNANTYGTDEGVYLLRINCSEFTAGTCTVDLSSDPYEATGIVKVTAYTNARSVAGTVLADLGKASSATWDWAEGAWSNAAGYPSAVAFYQDRLCFACTYTEPQTEWMSKTGSYTDFGRSTPLEDTDGITVNLPSRKLNGINNIVALQELLALTSASEWSTGPTQGSAVTPTSIDSRCHGYRGCSDTDPVLVGNRIVYVQPMGSVVRDLGYSYESNGYSGEDLSLLANHLFGGYSIIEMAYQQEPDSIVWCVRNDGVLLSLTYNREQEVVAWTWHDTAGHVESVCTIPSDGFNELWLVVRRGTSRFIERMVRRMATTEVKDQFFVDSGLTYDVPKAISGVTSASPVVITCTGHGFSNGDMVDLSDLVSEPPIGKPDLMAATLNDKRFEAANVTANTFELVDAEAGTPIDGSEFSPYESGGYARKPVSEVAGFDHLEGQTVSILADGNVLPPQVVTGGKVTLFIPASIVHVGLPYVSDLQTLDVELKLEDGTIQDRKVKIPQVTIRFENSRGGWIGSDETSLVELAQRTAESRGSAIPLFSGKYSETLNSGYDRGLSVFFRQADPLPVTILAIMPKVTPGG